MSCAKWSLRLSVACCWLACTAGTMVAQAPAEAERGAAPVGREQLKQPVYRVAQQQAPVQPPAQQQPQPQVPPGTKLAANNLPQAGELGAQDQHPLVPALQMAYSSLN